MVLKVSETKPTWREGFFLTALLERQWAPQWQRRHCYYCYYHYKVSGFGRASSSSLDDSAEWRMQLIIFRFAL